MGWLKLGTRSAAPEAASALENNSLGRLKRTTLHIETAVTQPEVQDTQVYSHQPISLPDSGLPHIPAEKISSHNRRQCESLWIVVNEVVYDCSEFISIHPGDEAIIESFGGTDCSWQFWRFHGKKEMEEFGRPLRIGRTRGVVNKYKEPVKYVGLLRRDLDEW